MTQVTETKLALPASPELNAQAICRWPLSAVEIWFQSRALGITHPKTPEDRERYLAECAEANVIPYSIAGIDCIGGETTIECSIGKKLGPRERKITLDAFLETGKIHQVGGKFQGIRGFEEFHKDVMIRLIGQGYQFEAGMIVYHTPRSHLDRKAAALVNMGRPEFEVFIREHARSEDRDKITQWYERLAKQFK